MQQQKTASEPEKCPVPAGTIRMTAEQQGKFHGSSIDDNIGKTVGGRYRLIGVLGQGGMGRVYLATDMEDGSKVAVKTKRINEDERELDTKLTLMKAEALKKIDHKNVVSVKDAGIFEDQTYVVMEHMKGHDLEDHIQKEKELSWEVVLEIAAQVCDGLEALHQHGIIHQDVKPENIFLLEDGTVKVFDFDISSLTLFEEEEENKKTSALLFGTPTYLPPELALGKEFDHRVDVYSLGVVMYEMICGVPPFQHCDAFTVLRSHIEALPIRPSQKNPEAGIPKEVEDIVMRALEKEPDRRFQSMDEMRAAILAA